MRIDAVARRRHRQPLFIPSEMQTLFSGAVRVPDRAFRVVLGFIPDHEAGH